MVPVSRTPLSRQYATSKPFTNPKPRSRRRLVILATTGGGAAAGLLAVSDDLKITYEAAERSSRVAYALLVCINE